MAIIMVGLIFGSLFAAGTFAAKSDPMSALLDLMQGEFRSENPSADDYMIDRRARVSAPLMGENVVYLQINSGPELAVYRQRLLVFNVGEAGNTILQQAWSFNSPEQFVDGFEVSGLFERLAPADLQPVLGKGCEQIWVSSGENWTGSVSPDTCRMWSERRQEWRRIGAESKLTHEHLYQAERGFNDLGEQVFGTPAGEFFELKRTSPSGK